MKQRMFRGLAAAVLMFGVASAATARPVVPAEKHFWSYDGTLPGCEDSGVLGRITDRFGATEHEYWNSELSITGYDHIATVALRPWGLDHIPRNFCRARARFSDNVYRTIAYAVTEDQGIIGMTYGVEWCVVGLDRDYAYAPSCKMENP